MDSREARKILMFYRPGDTDKGDPQLAAALELARNDPELAVWFGQHCAAHAIPSRPKERERDVITLSKPGLILIVVVALGLGAVAAWRYLLPTPENTFANYRDRMARLAQRSYPMKNTLADQNHIREYFRTNGLPADFSIPHNLERLPAKGSAIFTWNNKPVELMGFDAGNNTNLFLFVIDGSAFDEETVATAPSFARVGNCMTAIWTNSARDVFLLTGPNDANFLQGYLQ